MRTTLRTFVTLMAASVLAACGGSSGDADNGESGTMSLAVTDAPADDVERVQITFDRVELQPANGERIVVELDEPVTIENMLELQGSASEAIFDELEVAAGEYNFVRVFVIGGVGGEDDTPGSFVDDAEGNRFGLFVPGDQPPSQGQGQRFVQLNSPFLVPANGAADFTLDVELRDALVDRTNQSQPHYLLRPALRLVDNSEIGHLSGEVDATIATSDTCFDVAAVETVAAVYIYDGTEVTPGDACSSPSEGEGCPDDVARPVASALVSSEDALVTFGYEVGFLAEGSYTAALTCNAPSDDPESDDRNAVGFIAQKTFDIQAEETTELDFNQSDVDEEGSTTE